MASSDPTLAKAMWGATKQLNVALMADLLSRGVEADAAHLSVLFQSHSAEPNKASAIASAVELMLQHGADPRYTDSDGNTPLHYCMESGAGEEVVKALITAGAVVDARGKDNSTPLMWWARRASSTSSNGIANIILAHGASLSAKNSSGRAALSEACMHGQEDKALLLLDAGSEASHIDIHGYSALHFACERGLLMVVSKLVESGKADLAQKTSDGRSCLSLASGERAEARLKGGQLTQYLIDHGAPLEEKDSQGRTAVFYAAPDSLLRLLKAGASVSVIDNEGLTALDYAVEVVEGMDSRLEAWVAADNGGAIVIEDERPRRPPENAYELLEWGAEVSSANDPKVASSLLTPDLWRGSLVSRWGLFTVASRPMPPHRRTLRYLLTSTSAAQIIQQKGWPSIGAVKTAEEAREAVTNRQSLLRDDAWRRRRHLCIDRALWRKPEPSEPKRGKGNEEDAKASAGAGKT
jgi:uncharacterized protein